jgi:hypothetical protein
MKTILIIVLCVAAVFGLWAFIFSSSSSPKDRAKEAAGAAGGGAIVAFGCLFQAAIAAAFLLFGFWVLGKIFG